MTKRISLKTSLLILSLCLLSAGMASIPASAFAGLPFEIGGAPTTYDVTIFGTFVPEKKALNTYAFFINDQKKIFHVKKIQVHLTRPGSNVQGTDMTVLREIAPAEIRIVGKQTILKSLMADTTGKSFIFDGVLSVSSRYLFVISVEPDERQDVKGKKP